jgi:hypothetical protein
MVGNPEAGRMIRQNDNRESNHGCPVHNQCQTTTMANLCNSHKGYWATRSTTEESYFVSRPARPRPTALLPPPYNGKPEAATAVDKLLMMGMRMSETCWAVFKRQVMKLRNFCIWLVNSFEQKVCFNDHPNPKNPLHGLVFHPVRSAYWRTFNTDNANEMTIQSDFIVDTKVGTADAAAWRRRDGDAYPIRGKTRREYLSWLETQTDKGKYPYTSSDWVEITNQMQPCNRIYYSRVYWRLNMFRATCRLSSGALNCIYSLLLYTRVVTGSCQGTRPWQRPVTTRVYKPEAANTV